MTVVARVSLESVDGLHATHEQGQARHGRECASTETSTLSAPGTRPDLADRAGDRAAIHAHRAPSDMPASASVGQ